MKIGIIREEKNPPDSRVPLSPEQCRRLIENYDVEIFVQPSHKRCFHDEEYEAVGIPLKENLSGCHYLFGVKEIPVHCLLPGKTYFFFSHTIKKQPQNRKLLQTILKKKIRLIDYELLTDDKGDRVIAFGRFAGIVGAHNGLWAYGEHTGKYSFPRMYTFRDFSEAVEFYHATTLPPMKIILTGRGRVGKGALEVLSHLKVSQTGKEEFLNREFDKPVFVHLNSEDFYRRKDGKAFEKKEFYTFPHLFESAFLPFTKAGDLLIHGIYWDPESPQFFSIDDMIGDFRIKTIADITCDLCGSIPATIRSTSIQEPVFGFDPVNQNEIPPFQPRGIDIMAVDNLPSELARDASQSFGKQLIKCVLEELQKKESPMLNRATIAENGMLNKRFEYLDDYVKGL